MSLILLIEDDTAISETLSEYLKSEGYTVRTASGQKEGLQIFQETAPDCVLLDISLADGNGFSVCSAIRSTSETPVIFLTASADEACTVAGFEIGADDYISKPFRPRELSARIRNVLRRHTSAPKILRCHNLTLDPAKALVMKNNQEVFLSALEYRLLLLFLSNSGQLISRDRIADELWTISGEFIGDNTLNVYMKRLRDKIEDDPQNPQIIRTVRGLGYKASES
ncbi:MAG: response regulator transcription factor [Oscillospiraceae bacterium]|nr:response regulator transcription factor [Oscillospiraceae bacterium]